MKAKYIKFINILFIQETEITSETGFINIDDSSVGGSHCVCFRAKSKKSFSFDWFGGCPDKTLLDQLTKPISYYNYIIQDINSKLCGSYCLYSFHILERTDYFNTISKKYFEYLNMPTNVFGNSSSFFESNLKDIYLYKSHI